MKLVYVLLIVFSAILLVYDQTKSLLSFFAIILFYVTLNQMVHTKQDMIEHLQISGEAVQNVGSIYNQNQMVLKNLSLTDGGILELGSGAKKQGDAGKIGYQTFTPNALDIVGAGNEGINRTVKIWDNLIVNKTNINEINTNVLKIGGWTITDDGGHLVFKRGDAGTGDDQPHIRMSQDGNLWLSRSTGKGWVADNIGNRVPFNYDLSFYNVGKNRFYGDGYTKKSWNEETWKIWKHQEGQSV